ncbi:MAG: hypothetical protein AB8H12_17585, partial [Lewinella sp.]
KAFYCTYYFSPINMKYRLLSGLALLLLSCSTTEPEITQFLPTVITGEFVDYQQYPNTRKVVAEGPVYWSGNLATDSIADDGSFRLAFDLYAPEEITLKPFIYTYVNVEPGDSLHLVIKIDDGAGVEFSGDRAAYNNELYTFHNGGFIEEWGGQKSALKRLGLNDALTYLGSFYEIDTTRLNEFIEAKSPAPELVASLSAYLLNRHFGLLFEHGMERQREDLQAVKPDTEGYFRAVASQFRSHLPTLKKHPRFKQTMFTYNSYFAYHKLHGPFHKLITDPEDYPTYHEIVELEEDPDLQQALLFSFGETLLDIGKPDAFTTFWDGISTELRKGAEMKKLYQLYLHNAPVSEAAPAS